MSQNENKCPANCSPGMKPIAPKSGSTAAVPDAILKADGDVIVISDHANTLRLNRDAAKELLKRLPGLIAKLPMESADADNSHD